MKLFLLRFPRVMLLGAALFAGTLSAADAPMLGATKTTALNFLTPGAIDLSKILPPPPEPGSITAQADLETILQVQAARTPEQVAWAKFIEVDDVFENARVLGDWFIAANLPVTMEFFRRVTSDSSVASNTIKALYDRPRPPKVDARVHPCVDIPKSASYPSGHAMRAALRAALLAEIFPEKRTELQDFADRAAWGRIIGGVHFPTDIMAGKLLGNALATELLKNPAVRTAVEKCRAEAQPFLLKKAA